MLGLVIDPAALGWNIVFGDNWEGGRVLLQEE